MKENSQDVLTVGVFNKLLSEALAVAFEQFRIEFGAEIRTYVDERIDALDRKMMSGFEAVFRRFDEIDNRLDSMMITKVDTGDVLLIEKRVTKLEEKTV